MMITSTHNPLVQEVKELLNRPKARKDAKSFVVEGVRLVDEAIQAGLVPRRVLYTASLNERGAALVTAIQAMGVETYQASESVLQAASDTQTPQGLVAIVPFLTAPLPESPNFVLLLDQVRDPGNVGTILRSAAAAGVQAVLLAPGSADLYAPKVLRAGMGAHFRLPVRAMDWDDLTAYLAPLHVYLADAEGKVLYTEADFTGPLVLIIGGEAEGAGEQVNGLNPIRVQVPMPGKMESLNAAMAAGILMFEVVRQRG